MGRASKRQHARADCIRRQLSSRPRPLPAMFPSTMTGSVRRAMLRCAVLCCANAACSAACSTACSALQRLARRGTSGWHAEVACLLCIRAAPQSALRGKRVHDRWTNAEGGPIEPCQNPSRSLQPAVPSRVAVATDGRHAASSTQHVLCVIRLPGDLRGRSLAYLPTVYLTLPVSRAGAGTSRQLACLLACLLAPSSQQVICDPSSTGQALPGTHQPPSIGCRATQFRLSAAAPRLSSCSPDVPLLSGLPSSHRPRAEMDDIR